MHLYKMFDDTLTASDAYYHKYKHWQIGKWEETVLGNTGDSYKDRSTGFWASKSPLQVLSSEAKTIVGLWHQPKPPANFAIVDVEGRIIETGEILACEKMRVIRIWITEQVHWVAFCLYLSELFLSVWQILHPDGENDMSKRTEIIRTQFSLLPSGEYLGTYSAQPFFLNKGGEKYYRQKVTGYQIYNVGFYANWLIRLVEEAATAEDKAMAAVSSAWFIDRFSNTIAMLSGEATSPIIPAFKEKANAWLIQQITQNATSTYVPDPSLPIPEDKTFPPICEF